MSSVPIQPDKQKAGRSSSPGNGNSSSFAPGGCVTTTGQDGQYPGSFPGFGIGDVSGALGAMAGSAIGGPFGDVVGGVAEKGMAELLGSAMEGGLDALLTSAGNTLDPSHLASMLEGSAADLLQGGLSQLLAVNDRTPAGEAILKTLASKFQGELMDPSAALAKLNALFTVPPVPVSSASVPLGQAIPAGGGIVFVGGVMACARLGDMCSPIPSVPPDAGPFIQGNPTVIVNGKPAAGLGHLAVGLTKGTPGTALKFAPTVLMGTATVTDAGIYEKAKLEASKAEDGEKMSKAAGSRKDSLSNTEQSKGRLGEKSDGECNTPPSPERPDVKILKEAADMAYEGAVGDVTSDGSMKIGDVSDDPSTGFRGITLIPVDLNSGLAPIVAFAGTDPFSLKDHLTNFNQGADGVPAQYQQADNYVQQMQGVSGRIPEVTGHSLGGGLATYAGGMNNANVTTFNPARLSAATMNEIGLANPDYDFSKMTHYRNEYDPVSNNGSFAFRGGLPGRHVVLGQDPLVNTIPTIGGRNRPEALDFGPSHGLETMDLSSAKPESFEGPMTPGNTSAASRITDAGKGLGNMIGNELKRTGEQLGDLFDL